MCWKRGRRVGFATECVLVKRLPTALLAVLLMAGCADGHTDAADPQPEAPRAAIAPGIVQSPASCQDLAPTDLDLLGEPQVIDRHLDSGMCQYDVERARYESPADWPLYFRINISVGSPAEVLSYAEVEAVVAEDPAGAASHQGHEVTDTEEIDAAGWTYGFVSRSRSVENPGLYVDDEVARASLNLVTEDRALRCNAELFHPDVTLADARAGIPGLVDYCNTVRDALWES